MKVTRLFALSVFVLAAVPAQAQQLDSRWAPWLGCWQLVGERVRVCVAPATDTAGVTLSTLVENQVAGGLQASVPALEQTIVADGAEHPISEAECRGWQHSEWSRTGERLFARAELTCGSQAPRRVSGLSMIAEGRTWLDIQVIEIAGRENVRVRRYQRASDQTGATQPPSRAAAIAPHLGATPFTIEDVKEAAARVSPRAVEAALAETNASFDLSSRILIELDEAGVADSVIDLMVALSYSRHFAVDRPNSAASYAPAGFGDLSGPWLGDWPWTAAFPYSLWPYYAAWSGLYTPYYYSPFGYAYWAGYGSFPGSGFVTIDVDRPGADRTGSGRAINGVGYTRVRAREPEAEQTSAGGRQTNSGSSTTSRGISSEGSGSSGSSGGSSGGVSSQGFSSGSSSTDTGRTAQPR